ncbi:glutathione S-transferase family protein [Ramlibacter sp. PS4R-6]|uniref:glutathione S-transferase family protein n=1 Tax=Ramlibacter sp. PS4R-6 TaxID=3133438 RepID=UPI00309494B4
MTMKLYFGPGACSFVPHTLLETSGAAYEPVLVKLHKQENLGEAFRALNPRGQVPVVVDDGQAITQILAIVDYLDAKFPQCNFLPREPRERARVMETLAWMNNTAHPTFTHVFMPYKFVEGDGEQAAVKAHNAKLFRGMLGEIEAMAQKMQAEGRPFLFGEHFGPVDAYALTLMRWGGFAGIDPQTFPALWAHVQKVAELPAVKRAMERERLQLNVYKAA